MVAVSFNRYSESSIEPRDKSGFKLINRVIPCMVHQLFSYQVALGFFSGLAVWKLEFGTFFLIFLVVSSVLDVVSFETLCVGLDEAPRAGPEVRGD